MEPSATASHTLQRPPSSTSRTAQPPSTTPSLNRIPQVNFEIIGELILGNYDHCSSFSYIVSSSGFVTPAVMKRVYYLLLQLSLGEQFDLSRTEAALNELNHEFGRFGFKESSRDFLGLADVLFKELDRRFKGVFRDLRNVSFSPSPEVAHKDNDLWDTIEEFMLLLRSCLVIMTLVEFEQDALLEKAGFLLSVLRKLLHLITTGKEEKESISLEKSFLHECKITGSDCTTFVSEDLFASLCILEPSDPCHPFICAVLEVFVDELLMHRSLREYFMLVDSASSTNKMVFVHNLDHGGIGTVLEVISAHFILSVSNQQAFHNFLNRLYWARYGDLKVPELSLTSALSLLLNPVMLSAPKLFQAHFISLVCEVIGVFLKSPNPDQRLMDWYLVGFEKAIMLYNRHISNSYMKDTPLNSNGCFSDPSVPWNSAQQPFESYIHQVRREKINHLSSKYENTCLFFREKSELLALSISYVEENRHILDESLEDDPLSILHCILLGASQDDVNDTEIYKAGYTSQYDIYLLASILKLMSSSFLPAIRCLRHHGNSDGLKTLLDVSSSKEYSFILSIISCFQEFDIFLPNQNLISEVMKSHPKRHKNSKWMFLHFIGLLALSFSIGSDILVKDCGVYHLKSSKTVAMEFQKIQTIHVSSAICHSRDINISEIDLAGMECTTSLESCHHRIRDESGQWLETAAIHSSEKESSIEVEEAEETWSGEIFLKCLGSSSHDDIVDFVECKRGKDYSQWMKNRQKYRKWKSHKLAVLRWKKKKHIWKCIKTKNDN
ncbi:uncharacterized protein E5676_scaffold169G00230 [Cucumis melo var. makuwa]|uniref:DUF7812 domain-containing protein n=1 Tax=Cucumis melo var. makuwa TaxID=1194695 RepID=A0A5D3BNT8_CUCMM|nr:uncharacterized protein E5676_scaffold169G00230 [Cucumis melo var. makuwa]